MFQHTLRGLPAACRPRRLPSTISAVRRPSNSFIHICLVQSLNLQIRHFFKLSLRQVTRRKKIYGIPRYLDKNKSSCQCCKSGSASSRKPDPDPHQCEKLQLGHFSQKTFEILSRFSQHTREQLCKLQILLNNKIQSYVFLNQPKAIVISDRHNRVKSGIEIRIMI